MKWIGLLRQRLAWKFFLSYLVIILVGVVVLSGTAQLHTGAALDRHLNEMEDRFGNDPALAADLDANFHAAVNEILTVAALAALVAAAVVSLFTAQRIVQPVQAMMRASRHIADGDYHQRVQVTSQDELGTLARDFNQMALALEQTERRRMALVGDVAHELRTPLSSIKGVMEGLIDGVLPAEPRTFSSVQREVTRLQRLVQDLQELSRAEAGQIPLDMRAVAPGDIIRAAAERLRPQFEDKGVDLDLDLSPKLPQVRVDSGRVIQVLLNLLGNALQHTPCGGRVVVAAWREADEVVFAVKDTGVGISPEHLSHVFERFYRVDKSRSRVGGGSGIGLTIAKHLVEAHGGRIWADSPGLGQGTVFSFSLPFAS